MFQVSGNPGLPSEVTARLDVTATGQVTIHSPRVVTLHKGPARAILTRLQKDTTDLLATTSKLQKDQAKQFEQIHCLSVKMVELENIIVGIQEDRETQKDVCRFGMPVLAVVLAILLWIVPSTNAAYTMAAYDCSNPTIRDRTVLPSMKSCAAAYPQPKTQYERFNLLQQVHDQDITGYTCQKIQSQFKFHCGMFSHIAVISPPTIELPITVTLAECTRMVYENKVIVGGVEHDIRIGEELVAQYDASGILVPHENSISCQGVKEVLGQTVEKALLTLTQERIKVEKVTLRTKQNEVMVLESRTKLGCHLASSYCITSWITTIWTLEDALGCYLHQVKMLRGHVEMVDDENVFIDNDNKLRLIIKTDALQQCGHTVYTQLS